MKVEINRDGIIVKKSICVIEDEQDIRESVKEFFECNDYEVFDYSSAEDFYENKITEDFCRVYLLDWTLPGDSGIDIVKRIRTHDKISPIFILSAKSSREEVLEGLTAGADDYMTKPVSEQDLINVLLKWTQADASLNTVVQSAESSDTNKEKTLDWELSLKLANGKVDLAQDMLKMMVDSNHETGRVIHAAYQAQDFDELLQHIHKLHGASCYVGTPRLKSLSNQYETKLKKQQYNLLEDLHTDLIAELKDINQAAQPYIESETTS